MGIGCAYATVTDGCLRVTGTWTARADGTFTDRTTTMGEVRFSMAGKCLEVSGTRTTCATMARVMPSVGFAAATCEAASGGGCDCVGVVDQVGGAGIPNVSPIVDGHLEINDTLLYPDASSYSYCATGNQLALSALGTYPTVTGTMRFEREVVVPACPAPTSKVVACGGDVIGDWTVAPSCLDVSGDMDVSLLDLGCATVPAKGYVEVEGTWSAGANGRYVDHTITTGELSFPLALECQVIASVPVMCSKMSSIFLALGWTTQCSPDASGTCACVATAKQSGGLGVISPWAGEKGDYSTSGGELLVDETARYDYCANGDTLAMTPKGALQPTVGTIRLGKKAVVPGTGGAITP